LRCAIEIAVAALKEVGRRISTIAVIKCMEEGEGAIRGYFEDCTSAERPTVLRCAIEIAVAALKDAALGRSTIAVM